MAAAVIHPRRLLNVVISVHGGPFRKSSTAGRAVRSRNNSALSGSERRHVVATDACLTFYEAEHHVLTDQDDPTQLDATQVEDGLGRKIGPASLARNRTIAVAGIRIVRGESNLLNGGP